MKDPFTIEMNGRSDVKRRSVAGFKTIREDGDAAPWLQPGQEDAHVHTDDSRLRPLFYLLALLFLILAIRVGFLQIVNGDQYRVWAEENRIRIRDIKPSRGIITDSSGIELVKNIPSTEVTVTTADLPSDQLQRDNVLNRVADILGTDRQGIRNLVESVPKASYEPLTVAERVTHEQALMVEIESEKLPGVQIETTSTREYVYDELYAHVLGYVGKLSETEYAHFLETDSPYVLNDVIGKTGIEYAYEQELRGQSGKKEIEVDAQGKEKKVVAETRPVIGNNLILTLDHGLQSLLYNKLMETTQRLRLTGAAAVALDPRNGQVRALVSVPSYSPNDFVSGISVERYAELQNDPRNPLFFRSISGEYPSGSVIKPVIAAAALQERVVTPTTTYLSSGGIRIGDWFFPDWKAGGHGQTDIRKAIAESVNTFFYYAGGGDNETFTGLGVDRIRQYAERFGLNAVLGIDIPGEASGFLPTKEWKQEVKGEPWYIGDTYHLAIGQGDLLVTPLQVASYTSTIANGGTVFSPRVVESITGAESRTIRAFTPTVLRDHIVDESTLRVVKEGMRQAVTSGSARRLNALPIETAAKTGTAQFGNAGKTHAWFSVFFPYEKPQIALAIILEGGGEGSETALPIAYDAIAWWAEQHQ